MKRRKDDEFGHYRNERKRIMAAFILSLGVFIRAV